MGSPLRVEMIAPSYNHWASRSGISQLFRHLDPREVALTTYTRQPDDGPHALRLGRAAPRLQRALRKSGMAWYNLTDLAAEMKILPKAVCGGADIIHFLEGDVTPLLLPLIFSGLPRSLSPRLIATFHQPPELLTGMIPKSLPGRLDAVITVSPCQAEFFRLYLPPEKVFTVLHGIDTDFYAPSRFGRKGPVFTVVTVGHWLRDFRTLKAVAQELLPRPEIRFQIVTHWETGLEDLPNVTPLRNLNDDELRRTYQRADVLLLPLHQSTANNAILESIACGLPVITTRLASTSAYLPSGEAILVDRGDIRGLLDAVLLLAGSPSRCEEMGRAARRRAEALAWPGMARRHEEIYRLVAGGTVASAPQLP